MRISFKTFGCRTNQIETESIKQNIARLDGFEVVDEEADIVVINSCCVTQKAELECINFVDRLIKRKPDIKIIFTGCLATYKPDIFKDKKNIHVFVNEKKHLIYNYITGDDKDLSFFPVTVFSKKTRGFIKIQEGCNMGCSYCIVSLLRSRIVSKNPDDVEYEFKTLLSLGVKEIVLSGTRLGSYNYNGFKLSDLLEKLLRMSGDFRIRLSSIEIWEIDDKLIDVITDKKVCKHLHIPLQSASDKVLKIMKRPYTSSFFAKKIDEIRKKVGNDIGIYSDVIVGFPYEDEKDFKITMMFVKDISLAGLHVFTFSKRQNTPAWNMTDLPQKIKKDRSIIMHRIDEELRNNFKLSKIGKELEVLLLKKVGSDYIGLSSEFINIKMKGDLKINEFYRVRGVKIDGKYIYAQRV